MKQTQLPRNLPLPRNLSPKVGNLGISILENLGNAMNTMSNDMNTKNTLGNHKGKMNKSRNSLDTLGKCKNSQSKLSNNGQNRPRKGGEPSASHGGH